MPLIILDADTGKEMCIMIRASMMCAVRARSATLPSIPGMHNTRPFFIVTGTACVPGLCSDAGLGGREFVHLASVLADCP
jgi:hypothetical protein